MKSKKYTVIHFEFIPNRNYKLDNFFSLIKLGVNKTIFKSLYLNDLKIPVYKDEDFIYYNEIIDFYSKQDSNHLLFTVEYPIYNNKINNIYINYDSSNNANKKNKKEIKISAELLFQTTPDCLLPNSIKFNELYLKAFDYFKNKYRKRMGIFNFNPSSLEILKNINISNKNFNFEDGESYKIIMRYYNNKNNPEISITNFQLVYDGDKNKNKVLKKNKKDLNKSLIEFYNDFQSFINDIYNNKTINKEQKKIMNDKYNNTFIESDSYYNNILNYNKNEFEELDKSIFHYIFYYKIYLTILEMYEKDEIILINTIDNYYLINKCYEIEIKKVLDYKCELQDSLLLIKAYNEHFLNSFKTGIKINYISFIEVKELDKYNPYYLAINFIINIINNLKEYSRLFEILINLDCEIITNLLIENEEIKDIDYKDIFGNKLTFNYGKNQAEYGINLLNIEEVKNHLLQLVPRFIIRIDSDMRFRANYTTKGKIMTINEKILFKCNSSWLDRLFKDKAFIYNYMYILPIVMEILHEIYGHGKLRFKDDEIKSPLEMRTSKYKFSNFKIKKKIIKLDNSIEEVNLPESGIALERNISEDKDVINWLKSLCKDKKKVEELLDISLWIDKDFSKLESIVKNFIESEKKDNYFNSYNNNISNSNDDSIDDLDLYDCGFSP